MRLTNKKIKLLKWWLPVLFSLILSIVLISIFDLHWYNVSYWVISLSLQVLYNDVNDKVVDFLYDLKSKRRLKFKEYVRDKKRGDVN